MNFAYYQSTRQQLNEAIKSIRPTYQIDILCRAILSLAIEYTKIKLSLMYARWRHAR